MRPRRTLRERGFRLAIQGAIFLALMIGVLLRTRSANFPFWEIMVRPVVVFAFGFALLKGISWTRWPLAGLSILYAWWYLESAMHALLPVGIRIGTGAGALLELCCAGAIILLAPAPAKITSP